MVTCHTSGACGCMRIYTCLRCACSASSSCRADKLPSHSYDLSDITTVLSCIRGIFQIHCDAASLHKSQYLGMQRSELIFWGRGFSVVKGKTESHLRSSAAEAVLPQPLLPIQLCCKMQPLPQPRPHLRRSRRPLDFAFLPLCFSPAEQATRRQRTALQLQPCEAVS